jgi:eukaryotic-like serine/threonine-protein kinase
MKTIRNFRILFIIILIAIAISACAGGSSRRVVASGWAGIAADDETAYLAYNTHVYAINLANGTERWRYPSEPDPAVTFYSSPALTEDGQLIIGGYNHTIYSLDPVNGQLNWTFEDSEGRFISDPLVTENGIYTPSTDTHLYALDFKGKPLWREPYATEKEIWAQPASDPNCDCIYLASMDHNVYAIDSQSGSLIWVTEDLGGAIVGAPAISEEDGVFVGTFAEELVALDLDSGNELWRFAALDWIWGGAALNEENLYFGDLSGTFFALDPVTGLQRWNIQPGGAIVDTPLVTEDAVYMTAEEGLLVSVTPDGVINWQQTFEGNTYSSPILANDILLIATTQPDALVVALDTNGVQKWSFGESEE